MSVSKGLAVGIVILAAGCGNNDNPAAPSPQTLHAEATDPAGDAVVSTGVPVAPDLVHVTADVAGANVTFAIQLAPRTLDPATTRVTVDLDTDQNPATGNAGGSFGIDYVLDIWPARTPPMLILQATPATCGGGGTCYVQVGTSTMTTGTDTLTTTAPLSMLGNASGRLNYRVVAYSSPSPATPTAVADVMPDISLPPAHIP